MSSQPVIVTRGRPAASDRRATSPELTEQAFGPTNKSTTVRQSHIASDECIGSTQNKMTKIVENYGCL
jgi:hypothetical protein